MVFVLLCRSVSAVTIASQGNPTPFDNAGLAVTSIEGDEVSWTSLNRYENVSISALLFGPSVLVTGTAYLNTQIGLGASTSTQIASSNFNFVQGDANIQLFSGLTLEPGTYYLVLSTQSTTGGGWLFATAPVDVTDAGTTIGSSQYYLHTFPGTIYPPAGDFGPLFPNEQFVFDVEGDRVNDAIPEPGSLSLMALALLIFGCLRSGRVSSVLANRSLIRG